MQLNTLVREKEVAVKNLTDEAELQKIEVIRLGKLNEELRKEKAKILEDVASE